MRETGWQLPFLSQLVKYLEKDDDVAAAALMGSLVIDVSNADRWADVDLLLIVKDGAAQRFFPTVDWLGQFGELLTFEQSVRPHTPATRACFMDGRRLDVVTVEEASLRSRSEWHYRLLDRPLRVLFSRSARFSEEAGQRGPGHQPTLGALDAAAVLRRFWFQAQLSLHKVVREDLLVASQLLAGAFQDYLLLVLRRRDEAEGTTVHRTGGDWNEYIERLAELPLASSGDGILAALRRLASEVPRLQPGERKRADAFLSLVDDALARQK